MFKNVCIYVPRTTSHDVTWLLFNHLHNLLRIFNLCFWSRGKLEIINLTFWVWCMYLMFREHFQNFLQMSITWHSWWNYLTYSNACPTWSNTRQNTWTNTWQNAWTNAWQNLFNAICLTKIVLTQICQYLAKAWPMLGHNLAWSHMLAILEWIHFHSCL